MIPSFFETRFRKGTKEPGELPAKRKVLEKIRKKALSLTSDYSGREPVAGTRLRDGDEL